MGGQQLHTLLVGGARSMKTFTIVRAIVIRAMRGKGSRHLIARFRYNHVKSSIMRDTMPAVMRFCFPGVRTETNMGEGITFFENGSEIWYGGLDDKERVDKILGQEYATIFPNECSQISYPTILTLRTRLAQSVRGLRLRAFYDLNPTGSMHWSNREFGQHIGPLTGQPLADPENFRRMFLNPEQNPFLPAETLAMYRNMPGRYRKRFFEGIYQPEVENALWPLETLARCVIEPGEVPKDLVEVVVAIDPSGTKGKDENKRSSLVGIIVAARARNGKAYVLADYTCMKPPGGKLEENQMPENQPGWGATAVQAFKRWKADRIIGEVNYGGAMVEAVINAVDDKVPFREVSATRGKEVRAEPISALYEKDLVYHAGSFPELEEQLANFATDGYKGEASPDRADALVWAMTDLMVDAVATITLTLPIQEAKGARIRFGAEGDDQHG